MSELAQALITDSYASAPSHILEGLTDDLVHRTFPNVPHSIYGELWHIAFWQRITLHWIAGIDIPYPSGPLTASPGSPQPNTRKSHGPNCAIASFMEQNTQPQPQRTPTCSIDPSSALHVPAILSAP